MAKVLNTPDFKNEHEEAEWWDRNDDLILKLFQEAEKDSTLGVATLAKRIGSTPTTTIRLDVSDVKIAKEQAEKRGLKYQTYLKMIIHQALAAEAAKP